MRVTLFCVRLSLGNDLFRLICDDRNLERDKSWQLKAHFEK